MLLEEYCKASGVSGCEQEIRDLILKNVKCSGETKVDSIGNLIVHKAGGGRRVMLSAHMDEAGFIVTFIKDDGRIKFAPVGSIDRRVLPSKRVIFVKNSTYGVIGSKPIHIQSPDEAKHSVDIKDMFIDIGPSSKEEVQKYVNPGDYAAFDSQYVDMGDYIKSKAVDSRAGCAIVTELLSLDLGLDLYGVYTVQHEVGLRGAGPAAFYAEPETAIVIDGVDCTEPLGDKDYSIIKAGYGPVISIMDRSYSADKKLLDMIVQLADGNSIPYQLKVDTSERSDAGMIQRAKNGCAVIKISIPARYINTPITMIDKEDYDETLKLIRLVLMNLDKGGI